MAEFGIIGLQLALKAGNNLPEIADEVASVRRRFPWVQMVVLPELAAYGPGIGYAQEPDGEARQAFAAMAKSNALWLVDGSVYLRDGERTHNVCTVYSPDGEIVAEHRKVYPFEPYERGVTPGNVATTFDVPGVGRFGLLICYDIWFPELARSATCAGAEVLINTVMTSTIDREAEIAICRATAATNQIAVISVNIAGDIGVGRSAVFGPGGEVIHLAGDGREVISLDVDFAHIRRCRERGWQGLGQVLKSFRDGPARFSAYDRAPAEHAALRALGRLEHPQPIPNDITSNQAKRG